MGSLLNRRDPGLLPQAEYESGLEQVGLSLPPRTTLSEHDLRRGGTRFVIRNQETGQELARFEFRRANSAER